MSKTLVLGAFASAALPSPPYAKYAEVMWPCTFVHMCEIFQVQRDVSHQDLRRILSVDPRAYRPAVVMQTTRLQRDERDILKCHAVLVCRAVVAACDRHIESSARPKRVRHSTKRPLAQTFHDRPAKCPRPAAQATCTRPGPKKRPVSNTKSGNIGGIPKATHWVTCARCGAAVRNDVISRHHKTEKCKTNALKRAVAWVEARAAAAKSR